MSISPQRDILLGNPGSCHTGGCQLRQLHLHHTVKVFVHQQNSKTTAQEQCEECNYNNPAIYNSLASIISTALSVCCS